MLLYSVSDPTGNYSLSQTSDYSLETMGISVRKQSLDSRFNESGYQFVKSILQHIVRSHPALSIDPGFLSSFSRVLVKDSTQCLLPEQMQERFPARTLGHQGKPQAAAAIQFEYDIKTSAVNCCYITRGTATDQKDAQESLHRIQPGDLIIRDLGYYSLPVLSGIHQRGAFFISKLFPSSLVFDKKGKAIDFHQLYQQMTQGRIHRLDLPVLVGSKERIAMRLSLSLTSEENYNHRIRILQEKASRRGEKLNQETKIRARFNLFISNISDRMLSGEQIEYLYHLRWQIELIFKQWKSIAGIDKLHYAKPLRILCMLYAKLILIFLCASVSHLFMLDFYRKSKRLISIHKAMKTIWSLFFRIIKILFGSKRQAEINTQKLRKRLQQNHWKERKKWKISFIDLFFSSIENNLS
jgi:hypothetical protein